MLRSIILASTFIAGPALAQETFVPARELAVYKDLVGTWKGSGTRKLSDLPDLHHWTWSSSCEWVLGGHFLRERIHIKFAPHPSSDTPEKNGAPGILQFETYYGWDRERQKHVSFAISNMNTISGYDIDIQDDVWFSVESGRPWGAPMAEFNETTLSGDERTLSTVGASGFDGTRTLEEVEGVLKRTSTEASEVAMTDSLFGPYFQQAPEQMERFEKIVGEYQMAGSMIPAPGVPEMQLSGNTSVAMRFSGSVCTIVVKGDPTPGFGGFTYQAHGFMAWNETEQCIQSFSIANTGEVHRTQCWWVPDGLFMTIAGKMGGTPSSMTGILKTGESGSMASETFYGAYGTIPPVKSFSATYTRRDSGASGL